jgi:flagellar basal-body rod modification protein FlgD
MATVGNLFPTTNQNPVTGATTGASGTPSAPATDPLANQATFLQLLVAQLKNQDPTQPVDGTTFVTQLAEFSNVEQNLGTRQDLDAISDQYLGTKTPPSLATDSTSNGTTGANSSDPSQQS